MREMFTARLEANIIETIDFFKEKYELNGRSEVIELSIRALEDVAKKDNIKLPQYLVDVINNVPKSVHDSALKYIAKRGGIFPFTSSEFIDVDLICRLAWTKAFWQFALPRGANFSRSALLFSTNQKDGLEHFENKLKTYIERRHNLIKVKYQKDNSWGKIIKKENKILKQQLKTLNNLSLQKELNSSKKKKKVRRKK